MAWREREKGISIPKAVKAINEKGVLLVYPINNRKEPESLWSYFYPRSPMRWVWDENGDMRVVKMWDLRERLSRTDQVVYSKWYQNRATFFSKELFVSLLSALHGDSLLTPRLSREAQKLWESLLNDTPQTTKTLKRVAKKEWGWEEKDYNRGMKELWQGLLICGCGEVDDGAFPSLNVGATEHLHEDLWERAKDMGGSKVDIDALLVPKSPWRRQFDRIAQAKKPTKKVAKKKKLRFEDL